MVRTVFSPKCWATSKTKRGDPFSTLTSKAFKIGGNGPSNWTSTTAPMTWVTLPLPLNTAAEAEYDQIANENKYNVSYKANSVMVIIENIE